MEAMHILKYEGLGNDFLIVIDLDRSGRYDASVARALCDRHRGIGADGLLRVSSPRDGGTFMMELLNADGSVAETSGNGMRCAVLGARHVGIFDDDHAVVETVVGTSSAQIISEIDASSAQIRVELGVATVVRAPEEDLEARAAYRVDVGNPHLVLLAAVADGADLSVVGPKLESAVPGGQNVELARIDTRGSIGLETWERGAGPTLACGSGSCAAAAAARLAGMVDDVVVVNNPGGAVTVELFGSSGTPTAALTGAARRIAEIDVRTCDLAAMVGATEVVA